MASGKPFSRVRVWLMPLACICLASQLGAQFPVAGDPTWTEQQELTAADGAMGDQFGNSVSVSGDTADAEQVSSIIKRLDQAQAKQTITRAGGRRFIADLLENKQWFRIGHTPDQSDIRRNIHPASLGTVIHPPRSV